MFRAEGIEGIEGIVGIVGVTWKNGPWTMGDVRRLRELKAQGKSTREIAAEMGRPRGSVSRIWCRYGDGRARPRLTPEIEARMRALAGRGASNADVARSLRVSDACSWEWARLLGLELADGRALHQCLPETRERLAQASSERYRRECRALGWPEVTRPQQALALGAIEAGARTPKEIADRTGAEHVTTVTKALRQLLLLRMVQRTKLPRARGTVGGKPTYAYRLAPWLAARKEDR